MDRLRRCLLALGATRLGWQALQEIPPTLEVAGCRPSVSLERRGRKARLGREAQLGGERHPPKVYRARVIWNREAETLPRERLAKLQLQRLRATVARQLDAVPLQRERLREAGLTA